MILDQMKKEFLAALSEATDVQHRGRIVQAYLAMRFDKAPDEVDILDLLRLRQAEND